jgi:hypothetical protein
MKTITSLLALALLCGCQLVGCQAESKREPSKYRTDCESIGDNINRCETNEAICYIAWSGNGGRGISCKWKEQR